MTVVTGASIAFAARRSLRGFRGVDCRRDNDTVIIRSIYKCRNLLFARFVLCNGMQMRPDEDDSLN
jgi:hypothetical protein